MRARQRVCSCSPCLSRSRASPRFSLRTLVTPPCVFALLPASSRHLLPLSSRTKATRRMQIHVRRENDELLSNSSIPQVYGISSLISPFLDGYLLRPPWASRRSVSAMPYMLPLDSPTSTRSSPLQVGASLLYAHLFDLASSLLMLKRPSTSAALFQHQRPRQQSHRF